VKTGIWVCAKKIGKSAEKPFGGLKIPPAAPFQLESGVLATLLGAKSSSSRGVDAPL